MRTKNLLLTAAVLAAGLGSAVAQSNVYSVNIVGYVNKPLATNALELIQNPLSDGTNTLNSTLGALGTGSQAFVWNGSGYSTASKPKAVWNPDLAVPTGLGMFVRRQGPTGTNTFVGSVVANVGTSVTNVLAANVTTLVGSLLPYADTLNGTNLGLAGAPTGSILYKWNGTGYTTSSKPKAVWNPDLSIGVGEGFFIKPSSNYVWVQTLPATP
jgi:hypothetical protein